MVAQCLSEAFVCNIKSTLLSSSLSFGNLDHMFFSLCTIFVYFSLHSVWFFFGSNFSNSCRSLARSFIKSKE